MTGTLSTTGEVCLARFAVRRLSVDMDHRVAARLDQVIDDALANIEAAHV